MIRRGERALWIGLLVGAVGTACWFVPMSLEYTWVFLILLVQLHLAISRWFPKDWGRRAAFFLVSGMVTNYLDFLSCETLTLLVPLLVLLWLERGEEKIPWKRLLSYGLCWLAGYAGMYLLKWLLTGIVMGENVLPYVLEHIEERTIGAAGSVGYWQELALAPLRNFSNLFPLDYGILGAILGGSVIFLAVYFVYIYRRKSFDKALVARLAVIGAIPYLRYLALANHSYLHVFFTYRAQFATLLAAVLIISEMVEWKKKGGPRRGKKR